MKEFELKPDTIKGILYTGKNKKTVEKEIEIKTVDGVEFISTPTGDKEIKADQYIVIDGVDFSVIDKKKFESKYKEVK